MTECHRDWAAITRTCTRPGSLPRNDCIFLCMIVRGVVSPPSRSSWKACILLLFWSPFASCSWQPSCTISLVTHHQSLQCLKSKSVFALRPNTAYCTWSFLLLEWIHDQGNQVRHKCTNTEADLNLGPQKRSRESTQQLNIDGGTIRNTAKHRRGGKLQATGHRDVNIPLKHVPTLPWKGITARVTM